MYTICTHIKQSVKKLRQRFRSELLLIYLIFYFELLHTKRDETFVIEYIQYQTRSGVRAKRRNRK